MGKVRITITLDEDVLRAVELRAGRRDVDDGTVIEDAVRRDIGLDLLERIWSKAKDDLSDGEAMALAVEAQHASRV